MKSFTQLVLTVILAVVGYTAQAQSTNHLKSNVQLNSLTAEEVLKETQITTAIHSKGKRVSINMNASKDKIHSVKIKNQAGIPQQSYTSRAGKTSLEMDLQILPKGKYLLAIVTKNKRFITYEFSKQ